MDGITANSDDGTRGRLARIAIRPVQDGDGDGVAALIAACFAEYPGCIYEPAEFPELAAPASWCAARGARMWVARDSAGEDPTIVGCICASPREGDVLELHKFYVAAHLRGEGLAGRLTDLFFAMARERRARQAMLWSDTRFARAHRYYGKLGFARTGGARRLHDVSDTSELQFVLTLGGG